MFFGIIYLNLSLKVLVRFVELAIDFQRASRNLIVKMKSGFYQTKIINI
jgi:hypothetical protein